MTGQILITTDRLILREAETSDNTFFFELLNSPKWKKFIGDRGIRNVTDAGSYIENRLISQYRNLGFGLYVLVLEETGSAIGICGFVKREYLDFVDLGYALLPQYEGKGYIYEAAKATLAYGKRNLDLTTILAISAPDNIGSKNVLNALGFTFKYTTTEPTTRAELHVFLREL